MLFCSFSLFMASSRRRYLDMLVYIFIVCFHYTSQHELTISTNSMNKAQIYFNYWDVVSFFHSLCTVQYSVIMYFNASGMVSKTEINNNITANISISEEDTNVPVCLKVSKNRSFVCNVDLGYSNINCFLKRYGFTQTKINNVKIINILNTTICDNEYIILYWLDPSVSQQLNLREKNWRSYTCNETSPKAYELETEETSGLNNIGLIIGLSIGGFLLLVVIIIVAVIVCRRTNKQDQVRKQSLATSDTSNRRKFVANYEEIDDVLNNGYSLAQPYKEMKQDMSDVKPETQTAVYLHGKYNDAYSEADPKTGVPPVVVPVTKQPDHSVADVNRVHIGGISDGDESYDFKNVYSKLGQNGNPSRQNYDDISTLKASIQSQSQQGSLSGQTSDTCSSNVINLEPSIDNKQPHPSEKIYSSL